MKKLKIENKIILLFEITRNVFFIYLNILSVRHPHSHTVQK